MDTSTDRVLIDGVPAAFLIRGPAEASTLPETESLIVMSRFASLRRHPDGLIAESARGGGAVVLADPRAAALLLTFSSARRADGEAARAAALPPSAAAGIITLFRAAGVLVTASQAEAEEAPPLAVWELHDMLFHRSSRDGYLSAPAGATYRFVDRFPQPPALAPRCWPDAVALPAPDWEQIERDDPPLAAVQSARMSRRRYGDRPVSLPQLAEFLYRVARVDDYWIEPSGHPGEATEFAARPYPSGGALYELELYPVIRSCDGVAPGVYHYAADRHVLEEVARDGPDTVRLIDHAAAAMGVPSSQMQAVIVITARMGRIAWKYEAIAYSLVLKHVGVIMQTMYLAATAMGLAPCALGRGDSDQFARATGIDSAAEPSVGEFALGSLEEPNQPVGRAA